MFEIAKGNGAQKSTTDGTSLMQVHNTMSQLYPNEYISTNTLDDKLNFDPSKD